MLEISPTVSVSCWRSLQQSVYHAGDLSNSQCIMLEISPTISVSCWRSLQQSVYHAGDLSNSQCIMLEISPTVSISCWRSLQQSVYHNGDLANDQNGFLRQPFCLRCVIDTVVFYLFVQFLVSLLASSLACVFVRSLICMLRCFVSFFFFNFANNSRTVSA